jgi:hypothetical protein
MGKCTLKIEVVSWGYRGPNLVRTLADPVCCAQIFSSDLSRATLAKSSAADQPFALQGSVRVCALNAYEGSGDRQRLLVVLDARNEIWSSDAC